MTAVVIQGKLIDDARSFRSVFAEALGFPDLHGGNFDACIDCIGYLGASPLLPVAA
jgi:RNAse (barnase) inhibitor barstar